MSSVHVWIHTRPHVVKGVEAVMHVYACLCACSLVCVYVWMDECKHVCGRGIDAVMHVYIRLFARKVCVSVHFWMNTSTYVSSSFAA